MAVNVAALRSMLQELKTGKSGQNSEYQRKFYNPPYWDEQAPLRSTIRILPSIAKDESGELVPFFSKTKLHKLNGHNVHCPKIVNKPCPICNYIRALWAADLPTTIQERQDIKDKKKYYLNVIARERIVLNEQTGKEEIVKNDGPLIYSIGVKVFERILKNIVDEEVGDITDLASGFDFKVKKEKQASGYPSYDDCAPTRKSTVAGTTEEVERWMSKLNDLQGLITFKSFEELEGELKTHITALANPDGVQRNDTPIATPAQATVAQTVKAAVASDDDVTPDEDDNFMKALELIKTKSA